MTHSFDLFVIGAGVAGLTAAHEAATKGLSVGLAEEQMFGGLALNVNHLWPGLAGAPTSGSELASELMARVLDLGVTLLSEAVSSVAAGPDGSLVVETGSDAHRVRGVIVASGARMRPLGVPGEAEFEDRGISHCADCDAPLYRDQAVMVVGGGDSALQEALVLGEFCSTVHVVHRGAAFTARSEFVEAVRKMPTIAIRFNTVILSLHGDYALTAVRLRELGSGEICMQPCTGLFPYVGLEPRTIFLPPGMLTDAGAIQVNETLESSLRNVFAIGAVRSGYGGQLSDAAQDARIAVAAFCEKLGKYQAV